MITQIQHHTNFGVAPTLDQWRNRLNPLAVPTEQMPMFWFEIDRDGVPVPVTKEPFHIQGHSISSW